MLSQEGLFVDVAGVRIPVTLVESRPRSRVYRLEDGRVAKVVNGSKEVREDPTLDPIAALWLARSRQSWRHLRGQTHPGLLRVGERVVDGFGDEGYLCEPLQVVELDVPSHPARGSLRDLLTCSIRLARAAGVMHRAGFVHGDITPANVLFRQNLPVLIDFEMTVRIGDFPSLYPRNPRAGTVCCTPDCCAPEHVIRAPVTPATDVYCIGVTILSWITERFGVDLAYFGQSERQSLGMCARGEYPHWDVAHLRIPHSEVLEVLARAVEFVPIDRYQDGDSLAVDLERVLRVLGPEQMVRPLNTPLDSSVAGQPNNLTVDVDSLDSP